MPRVMRRAKKRTAGYGEFHIEELLTGLHWPCFDSFHGDTQERREAWELLRDKLLPKWIAEHPGQRPFAWWAYDAPERRRRLGGRPHPFDNPARWERVEQLREEYPHVDYSDCYGLRFGVPARFVVDGDEQAQYEPEPVYMCRLGLLTDDEKDHPAVRDAIDNFGRTT